VSWTKWFLTLSYEDQAATWEALGYEEKVYRTTDTEIAEWAEVHEARRKCASAGPDEFVAYYESLQPAIRERVLREAPEVVTALRAIKPMPETYRETRDWFLTAPRDVQDAYWRDTLAAEEREQFLMDPRVNDWAQAYAARQYLQLAGAPTFKGYCQTLSDGAVALLYGYDDTRAVLES
jgi:hypothetical protein